MGLPVIFKAISTCKCLISPQIFAENMHTFAQCCVNSTRISEKFCFKKTEEDRGENDKKNMLLMFVKVKLGVKKIVLVNA